MLKEKIRKQWNIYTPARNGNGGVPNVAPFDVFEIAWTLWNLSMIPGYLEHIKNKFNNILTFSQMYGTKEVELVFHRNIL